MRNLKHDTIGINKSARSSRDQQSTETNAFKRDIQLLEKAILKKLDEKPISSGNLAAIILSEQETLIDRLTPHWQHREILRAIRSVRQEIGRQEGQADQYVLPGFEDLPQRIIIGKHKPRLAAITYPGVSKYLAILEAQEKRDTERIAKVKRLLALMEKYIQSEPTITVREVCERERE
jgi:hypothetical protein